MLDNFINIRQWEKLTDDLKALDVSQRAYLAARALPFKFIK